MNVPFTNSPKNNTQTMIIGIPKEIKEQEHRVALLPDGVLQLATRHRILVETNAGSGIGFSDEDYRNAGAEIIYSHEEVFARAELIVKVKEPLPEEVPFLRKDQILFTYLHLAANRALTESLLRSGVTSIAYESVETNRRLPLLEPMSEIAGRMSILAGGFYLAKHQGGSGVLLGGVPGVLPGNVVVIGGGTAGINAARMAEGLGANVTILEVDLERMRFLDITLGASTLFSNQSNLLDLLSKTNLLVGAVLVPGARAPRLVTRSMLKLMKPGSVFVDIAIDQGGCSETSRPTSHADPIFTEEGVIHYCVANMPGAYARTATQALTNASFPYLQKLADEGYEEATFRCKPLAMGVTTWRGHLTNNEVAKAHGLPFTEYQNHTV